MNTRLDITHLYNLFFKDYPDVLSAKDAMEILQISDRHPMPPSSHLASNV